MPCAVGQTPHILEVKIIASLGFLSFRISSKPRNIVPALSTLVTVATVASVAPVDERVIPR